MSYEKLSIQDFGTHLLRTGDLDPVYIALNNLCWEQPQIQRWLVAYWCFYDCGFASYVCARPDPEYWCLMMDAARNLKPSPIKGGRWPRGRERRHFRGESGINAIYSLRQLYCHPESMVGMISGGAPNYKRISARVCEHMQFGPWIGFKIADMLDRVLRVHVDFTQAAVFMFKNPVKAAVMYWNQSHGELLETEWPRAMVVGQIIPGVVKELILYYSGIPAPPSYDRDVNIQEVETILCKWKSHMTGHYPLNNDIHEIRDGVWLWVPHSEEACEFLSSLPELER